jgi:hypothetical protein
VAFHCGKPLKIIELLPEKLTPLELALRLPSEKGVNGTATLDSFNLETGVIAAPRLGKRTQKIAPANLIGAPVILTEIFESQRQNDQAEAQPLRRAQTGTPKRIPNRNIDAKCG